MNAFGRWMGTAGAVAFALGCGRIGYETVRKDAGRDANLAGDARLDAEDGDAAEDAEAAACACAGDVDRSGHVNPIDIATVVNCAMHRSGADCERADIDCDGAITYCDVDRIACLVREQADCCGAGVSCGACCESDTCVLSTSYACANHCGWYQGDHSSCADTSCPALPEPASCNADFVEPAGINFNDLARITDLSGHDPRVGACGFYDLNRDGVIDRCDVDAAICRWDLSSAECCDAGACVACCDGASCADRLDYAGYSRCEFSPKGPGRCATTTCP